MGAGGVEGANGAATLGAGQFQFGGAGRAHRVVFGNGGSTIRAEGLAASGTLGRAKGYAGVAGRTGNPRLESTAGTNRLFGEK